jgi:hypothetical protein
VSTGADPRQMPSKPLPTEVKTTPLAFGETPSVPEKGPSSPSLVRQMLETLDNNF